jgi:hypothetical protein
MISKDNDTATSEKICMNLKSKIQQIVSRCIIVVSISVAIVSQTVFCMDSEEIDLADECSITSPAENLSIQQSLIPRIKSRFITEFYLNTLIAMPNSTGNILGYLTKSVAGVPFLIELHSGTYGSTSEIESRVTKLQHLGAPTILLLKPIDVILLTCDELRYQAKIGSNVSTIQWNPLIPDDFPAILETAIDSKSLDFEMLSSILEVATRLLDQTIIPQILSVNLISELLYPALFVPESTPVSFEKLLPPFLMKPPELCFKEATEKAKSLKAGNQIILSEILEESVIENALDFTLLLEKLDEKVLSQILDSTMKSSAIDPAILSQILISALKITCSDSTKLWGVISEAISSKFLEPAALLQILKPEVLAKKLDKNLLSEALSKIPLDNACLKEISKVMCSLPDTLDKIYNSLPQESFLNMVRTAVQDGNIEAKELSIILDCIENKLDLIKLNAAITVASVASNIEIIPADHDDLKKIKKVIFDKKNKDRQFDFLKIMVFNLLDDSIGLKALFDVPKHRQSLRTVLSCCTKSPLLLFKFLTIAINSDVIDQKALSEIIKLTIKFNAIGCDPLALLQKSILAGALQIDDLLKILEASIRLKALEPFSFLCFLKIETIALAKVLNKGAVFPDILRMAFRLKVLSPEILSLIMRTALHHKAVDSAKFLQILQGIIIRHICKEILFSKHLNVEKIFNALSPDIRAQVLSAAILSIEKGTFVSSQRSIAFLKTIFYSLRTYLESISTFLQKEEDPLSHKIGSRDNQPKVTDLEYGAYMIKTLIPFMETCIDSGCNVELIVRFIRAVLWNSKEGNSLGVLAQRIFDLLPSKKAEDETVCFNALRWANFSFHTEAQKYLIDKKNKPFKMIRGDSAQLELIPAPTARMYSLLNPCHSCSTLPIIRRSSRQAEFVFRSADNFFGPLPNALLNEHLTVSEKNTISADIKNFMITPHLFKWNGAQETSLMIILMLPSILQIDFQLKTVVNLLTTVTVVPNFTVVLQWLKIIPPKTDIPAYIFSIFAYCLACKNFANLPKFDDPFWKNLSKLSRHFLQDFVESFTYSYPPNFLDILKKLILENTADFFLAHLGSLPPDSLTPNFTKLLQHTDKSFLEYIKSLYRD